MRTATMNTTIIQIHGHASQLSDLVQILNFDAPQQPGEVGLRLLDQISTGNSRRVHEDFTVKIPEMCYLNG